MKGLLGVHTGWASTSPDREWLPSGDVALVDEDVAPLNARKAEPRSNLEAAHKRRADGDSSDEEPLIARREKLIRVPDGATNAGSWGTLEGELLAGRNGGLIAGGLCRLRRSETCMHALH